MTQSVEKVKSERHARAGRMAVAGHFPKKHGHAYPSSPTYVCWYSMIARCENPKHKSFERYGGRGIKVCGSWRDSFEAFLADMGERPDGMTLGRIDNDGDYCPENCEWQSWLSQQNNRSNNRLLSHRGKTMTLQQWAEETGIKACTISRRIDKHGWSIADALDIKVGQRTRWTQTKGVRA